MAKTAKRKYSRRKRGAALLSVLPRRLHHPKFHPKSMHLSSTIGKRMMNFSGADPFKPTYFTKLIYEGSGNLGAPQAVTALVGTVNKFYINDPYDPYGSVGGALDTSAYGLIAFQGLYQRMKCHGAMVEVKFFNPHNGGSPANGLAACMSINNPSNSANTIAGVNWANVDKSPWAWSRFVPAYGGQSVKFKQYFPMHTVFEMTKEQYRSDIGNTTAPTAGSPTLKIGLELGAADTTGSDTAGLALQYQIKITYFMEFYQRYLLNIST